ncbi:MAG: hypothetical protein KGL39_28325 [Patescibacteria group bacterium]|nr:hypothetical protein [Patescibacteria group bacterium]
MSEFDFELDDIAKNITVRMQLEFYLRNRQDPLQVFSAFEVPRDALEDEEDPVDILMFYMESAILTVIDTRGEERMVFTDERNTKYVVMRDEIQAISALAPDLETILAALEQTE